MPTLSRHLMPTTPARQATIREANLALLYRLILDSPTPVSRAALAAATGMTRATSSTLADALLAAGLAEEVAPPRATSAGRPAAGMVPATSGPAGLGLEVNVDYLAACLVDLAGNVRRRIERRGDQRGRPAAQVLADLAAMVEEVATPGLRLAGAAIAVPGLVDPTDGRVRRAPNLGWQDLDVTGALNESLADAPLGTVVGNEAAYAALAEVHAGVGRLGGAPGESAARPGGGRELTAASDELGSSGEPAPPVTDFLYVSGEIGVGAGIVLGREIFAGTRGWSGEIGHVTVEPGGARCRCGAAGCLETVAGLETLRRDGPTRAGAALGRAIAAVVNVIDVPSVVLGGVYARPEFAATLAPEVERALAEHVVSAQWAPVDVHISRLGEAAAAQGAALAVIRTVHADPARWIEHGSD